MNLMHNEHDDVFQANAANELERLMSTYCCYRVEALQGKYSAIAFYNTNSDIWILNNCGCNACVEHLHVETCCLAKTIRTIQQRSIKPLKRGEDL